MGHHLAGLGRLAGRRRIFTPPNFVALSLSTAFANGALGMLGQLLATLLGMANFAVTLLATGWAMSRVTPSSSRGCRCRRQPFVRSSSVIEPPPVVADRDRAGARGGVLPARSDRRPVAVRGTGRPAAPAAVSATAGDGKQCPKCSLYETEQGKVIGWYCRVCGWRESRR